MALAPKTTVPSSLTESGQSALSWAAIIGGAVVAAALALILLALGVGLGLSSVSPYAGSGASSTAFTITGAVWLIVVQILSSGMGGYLAGRMRTLWSGVDRDEVHFRDTAHGFMVWALGTIVSASLLASAAGSLAGTGAQATGSVLSSVGGALGSVAGSAGSAASQQASSNPSVQAYFTDLLFRGDKAASDPNNQQAATEAAGILEHSLAQGEVSPADRTYLGQVIAAKTGLSQADAEKRVDDVANQAKSAVAKTEQTARDAAEAARKAGAYFSLWLFASMLVGAFSATLAATIGGRARDKVA